MANRYERRAKNAGPYALARGVLARFVVRFAGARFAVLRFAGARFAGARFAAVRFAGARFVELFFALRLRAGTFAPARRASESPIAIACFLLATFFPERPERSLPRFISCIALPTFEDAFLLYCRAIESPFVYTNAVHRQQSTHQRGGGRRRSGAGGQPTDRIATDYLKKSIMLGSLFTVSSRGRPSMSSTVAR